MLLGTESPNDTQPSLEMLKEKKSVLCAQRSEYCILPRFLLYLKDSYSFHSISEHWNKLHYEWLNAQTICVHTQDVTSVIAYDSVLFFFFLARLVFENKDVHADLLNAHVQIHPESRGLLGLLIKSFHGKPFFLACPNQNDLWTSAQCKVQEESLWVSMGLSYSRSPLSSYAAANTGIASVIYVRKLPVSNQSSRWALYDSHHCVSSRPGNLLPLLLFKWIDFAYCLTKWL